MSKITDKLVDQYMLDILPARSDVLLEMEEQARRRDIPIIGPVVARILYQYARLINAKRIFEMGSAIGYSTLWLAMAVGEKGKVYYTDGSESNAAEARGYFERAGLSDRIEILIGESMSLLEGVDGVFDLIFNDIDKHQYPDAFRKAIPRLRKGGLFVTDNVLWDGRVARDNNDCNTKAIRELNNLIYSTPGLFPVIIPARDGLAVCLKE